MIIEQQPDTLTLCGNLKDFIVSGVSTLSFILSDSGQTLINEVYEPGADGKIRIRIKDIIKDTLKVLIPSYDSDICPQPEAVRTFTADLGGEQIIFTVIKGGIHSSSASIISFLRQNFLSWQPQIKHITARQPEWLSYYAEDDCDLKLKAYFEDTTEEIKTINLAGGRITTVNLHYDKVNNYFEKNVGYYDVWVEKAGQRMTYIQRYILIPEPDTCELYVFENSVGGVDSFMCTGEHSLKPQTESTLGVVYSNTSEITNDFSLVYKQNTGFVPNLEYAKWLMDFFSSQQRYHVTEEGLRQIYMEDSDNEFKNSELNSFEFEFRYTDQTVYNRVVRNYDFLPKLLEFPQDGELFFLTPRLSEYPFATYSDDLILPVQHPYSGKWYHLPASLFKPERVDVNISDATYTNKGIASFSEKYFSVGNGHISLKEEILSATASDFSKYFYEKEGQLYCKLDLIGEKGVSAYGLGPDGSSGGGWDLIDDVTSTRTDAGLTANMGRYLKSLIDGKASSWETITGKPDFFPTSWDSVAGKPDLFPPAAHSHSYLPLTGGTLTGDLTAKTITANGYLQGISNTHTVQIGSENRDYCHYRTTAAKHWFDKPVYVFGDVYAGASYNRRLAYVDELTNSVLYNEVGIDATGLDQNKWYPVTVNLGSHDQVEIRVIVSLQGNKPSWASHAAGFSCRFVEVVNGCGWGVNYINRRILCNDCRFASVNPVGGVTQNDKANMEIIYVRGGGYYYFHVSTGAVPVLHASGYNWVYDTYSYSAPVRDSILNDNWQWEGTSDLINRANKLHTARTLWGQPFDGTGNVSGHLSDVDGLTSVGSEATYTTISGRIGSPTNGVIAKYSVQWYKERWEWLYYRGGSVDIQNVVLALNGTQKYRFDRAGNFLATGEITAYSASDRRLKENIETLIGRASNILKRLNPVEFDWNDTAMKLNPAKHQHDYSFLADEYGEVFPFAVSTIYEKYQSIDTKILLPLLVAGFKELDKRLNNLEQVK